MAYKELSDVKVVVLGGIDKKTGKKNPTELEGYFLRVEHRPNQFDRNKPQNFYVFQTEEGEAGVYGKAGIDREMRKATAGRMTKIVSTGQVLDTGKGNPMKIFKVMQDRDNTIEIEDIKTPVRTVEEESEDLSGSTVSLEDLESDDLYEDESAADEVELARPKAPIRPAAVTASKASQVQALLSKRRVN